MLWNKRRPSSPKTVMISGWYGTDNAGDNAILEQFIAEIVEKRSLNLFVLTEVPERIEQCYGRANISGVLHTSFGSMFKLRASPSGSRKRIESLRRCELFVLGGGGILRDNTSWSNLLRVLDEIWIAKLFGIKVAVYAIGAGPFKSALGKWFIRKTLTLCDLITVREESSKESLVAIGVPAHRIVVGADPAILLEPKPISTPRLGQEVASLIKQPGIIGLFVEEDYTPLDGLACALDQLHSQNDFRFVSVPMRCHDGRDDRKAARMIQAKMRYPQAIHVLEEPLTAPELKWLAGQFPCNITVRLHALIFSLSMCTPAIAINYEPKVAAFLKSFDFQENGVDPGSDVAARVVERVVACTSDLESRVEHIRSRLAGRSEAARLVFESLKELLDSEDTGSFVPASTASQS